MTNRIQYTDYQPPETKQQEVEWLADFLAATDKALTLENARAALTQFVSRAPGEWLLTPDDKELPELWAEIVEPVTA